MSQDPDEDLIEATIRRVAAAKAARALDDEAEPPANEPVSAAAVGEVPDVPEPEPYDVPPPPASRRPAADESLIEATLRRIEAEQAARAAEASAAAEPTAEDAPESRPVPSIHLVRQDEDEDAFVAPPVIAHSNLAVAAEPEPVRREAPAPDPAIVAALRRDLDELQERARALSARLDAIEAASAPAATSTREPRWAAQAASRADDWDDAPVVPRFDTGLPPRPAIVREAAAPLSPEAEVRDLPPQPASADAGKKGFDLLPRTYRITVEDKRRGVDLVPLHRALLGMDGVRDMSLLSYSNGAAIVSLDATAELSPDALGAAVEHATTRRVKVEVHNEQTMVVKLAED